MLILVPIERGQKESRPLGTRMDNAKGLYIWETLVVVDS